MDLCRRRTRKLLVVALAAIWVATLACADTVVPAAHPPHRPMPCCPRSGKQSAQCPPDQCDQAFEKTDARFAAGASALHRASAPRPRIPQPSLSPVRELTPGLFFRAPVFRLKDDLRI